MTDDPPPTDAGPGRSSALAVRSWLLGLGPLVLLILFVGFIVATEPLARLRADRPPIESLAVERVILATAPDRLSIQVVNGGPDEVVVAQVIIDDAFWTFGIRPGPVVEPLGVAAIDVPYPWVEGEPLDIRILTSTGATADHRVEVATATPEVNAGVLLSLAIVGIYVGVIPVAIGLLWLPFLRRLRREWVDFFLAFTVGLLVLLAADATSEAIEIAATVPDVFNGVGILVIGVVTAASVLLGMRSWLHGRSVATSPLRLATLVALSIGLHNLGEGLAIAAAYSIGAAALTTRLTIGFAIHNATEGLAIAAPLASAPTRWRDIVLLGLLAGLPAIVGAWIGGLFYSPALAILFLGLGVGAIVQVIWEIGQFLAPRGGLSRPINAAGVAAGVIAMYLTALLVG